MISIAFYKGKGDWTDKLIRWWTKSPYSHVELVIGDPKDGDWISTSPRTMRLEKRHINYKPENWDVIQINEEICDLNVYRVQKLYIKYKLVSYDWFGIFFSQIIPLNKDNKNKLFCSEWVMTCLLVKDPNKYSPGDVYQYCKDKNYFKGKL